MQRNGFNNHLESESIPETLPRGQNSPQHCALGLYAEQLSGTAFTMPRSLNKRSWLYRRLPSVMHTAFEAVTQDLFQDAVALPNQMRWDPLGQMRSMNPADTNEPLDWIQGLQAMAEGGRAASRSGLAIFLYHFNAPMLASRRAFCSADGDMLIVPQHSSLNIMTEFGLLHVSPNQICVVPRGIKFAVDLANVEEFYAQGYILEVYDGHFELPDLGPLGANGLANPQDFEFPSASEFGLAANQNRSDMCATDFDWTITHKMCNVLYECRSFTPFDVVSWRGNYVPFKYDLAHFMAFGSVTFDHPDPSIFTVLTCKSAVPGQAIADFVIFPPRWQVAQHTFRPPYFHRNVMAEFMGIISGEYEAKANGGFVPGGASLHPACSAHGPDKSAYEKAIVEEQVPVRVADRCMAFMFETWLVLRVTPWALDRQQSDYNNVWSNFVKGD